MAKKDELNFENGSNLASGEKLKALQAAMDKIEKSFGKGSIMKMGDESVEQVEVIPTGSIGLNVALGVGGYPRGRIIEIYGPESSGAAICFSISASSASTVSTARRSLRSCFSCSLRCS